MTFWGSIVYYVTAFAFTKYEVSHGNSSALWSLLLGPNTKLYNLQL